jgi:hypothetical protein
MCLKEGAKKSLKEKKAGDQADFCEIDEGKYEGECAVDW